MDWQVDTVTELHKATWMETSFPSLVWNEECTEVLRKMKGPWQRCADAAALEFSIKESGKESARKQTPSSTEVWQAGAAFQESKHEHGDHSKWHLEPSI